MLRKIHLAAIAILGSLFLSWCKTVNKDYRSQAPSATAIHHPDITIRAQSVDQTLRLEMDNHSQWLEEGQVYRIRYQKAEGSCQTLEHEAQFKASSKLIRHRLALPFEIQPKDKISLCILQGERVLHQGLVVASAIDPLAKIRSKSAIVNYGRRCASEIESLPPINCLDGELIPITVNGQEPQVYTPGMSCDRPALLDYQERADGQCMPYSRVQRIALADPDTLGVVVCRRYKLRDQNDPLFDDVSIIIHRKSTGATCFFQMPEDIATPRDGRRVPPPHELSTPDGSEAPHQFWLSPRESAQRLCLQCHDSDPFIHSPWIAQTGQVPSAPLGPYKFVGEEFSDWPTIHAIDVKGGNNCTSCHRMGEVFSCNEFLDNSTGQKAPVGTLAGSYQFPESHWMPPDQDLSLEDWQAAYGEEIARLKSCCKNPAQDFCIRRPITENLEE